MRLRLLVLSLLALGLGACSNQPRTTPWSTSERPPSVLPDPGADRDAHGCIPSAGYRWCVRTRSCERPWELAKARDFANTREAFDSYCGNVGPQPSVGPR